jgi:hypothetical protein
VRESLGDGVEALLDAMLAARGGRAFGVCRTCRHFAADSDGAGRHDCRLLNEALAQEEAGQIRLEQQAARSGAPHCRRRQRLV